MAAADLVVAILEADARFHRERFALYRSREHPSSPGTALRRRHLERAYRLAESRLARARRDSRA
jgi:hypothetical protein